MRKKSDVDTLIEQCIQDSNYEYLEEGFMDNIKAGLNGAKEWLKADARNSFKLRNKNDVKNDRRWSQRKGKVSSYAKSIANTLQDYKKSGGTLGRGMKVDDVISRLNQVAQGKYPRANDQMSAEKNIQSSDTTTSDSATTNNSVAQDRMLNSIKDTVPQKNTTKNVADTDIKPQIVDAQNNSNPVQKTKPKGDSFVKKAGKAVINGAKKMSDSIATGFKNFKERAAEKAKSKVKKEESTAKEIATAKPEPPSQKPVKKKLSPAENAKKAIAKAQAATQKAKSNAPKLNIPGSGKPIKRKRIINAKQDKDITAARKEQEDFHRSLGNTGGEWEERVYESYYSSNSSGQLRMLNSIR